MYYPNDYEMLTNSGKLDYHVVTNEKPRNQELFSADQ